MYIQIEGQILYYEQVGEGAPLLLLHGNCEDHHIFDELVEELQERYTCYLLDTRGHGESATPSEFHYADMAEDLAGVVTALHLEQPTVLGFSDGGIIALMAAMKYQDLFSRLLICGANFHPKGLHWKVRREIKKSYKESNDPRLLLMLEEPNISEFELSQIRVPVQIIVGENDFIIPEHTRRLAAVIPESKLFVLAGETHGSYIVHETRLAPII